MSDPTDTGQRNPLSSSVSHASGTSARAVSVQPDGMSGMTTMPAQDDVGAPALSSSGEAYLSADADPRPGAEGGNDAPSASVTEQQSFAQETEAAVEFTPSHEPVAEQFAQAETEFQAEFTEPAAPAPEDQPLMAASAGWDVEAPVAVADAVEEPAYAAAVDEAEEVDEPEDAADLGAAPADTPSAEDTTEPDPLPDEPYPDTTSELRAVARQKLAENEARQAHALVLFEQVSRRFTAALEEAGVDAARVTYKVMEFAQASLKNNLELAQSYTAARSMPDIFGLHAAYLTRQFELLNAQAEEMREITAKFAMRNTASLTPKADPAAHDPR